MENLENQSTWTSWPFSCFWSITFVELEILVKCGVELIGPKVEWEPDFFGHEWRKIEIWVGSTHFEWAPPILSGLLPVWVSARLIWVSASVRRVKMCKFCFLLLLKHSKNLLPFQKITENQLENARINKQARQKAATKVKISRRRPKSSFHRWRRTDELQKDDQDQLENIFEIDEEFDYPQSIAWRIWRWKRRWRIAY